jgi:glycosyltransferase involved in cell wall biosynthesis
MDRPLRLVYAAGPGDVIGTYRHWVAGRDDPAQVAITYSGQFYEFCKQSAALGLVISSHSRKEKMIDGAFVIEHRPAMFARGPGALYHLGQILAGLRLLISAVLFRADLLIVAEGTHWFVLGLFPWFGIQVVPTLHCVLWRKNQPPVGRVNQLIWILNRRFFRKRVFAILSLSNDITTQVKSMLGNLPVPIIPFLPSYRPESFGDGFGSPPPPPPFRVFFAGRIERNKGVFDLLDIARRFAIDGHTDIEFDLCGDGSQLQTLQQQTSEAGFEQRFRLHGHSTKAFMRSMYEQCHVVVVPTTSDFVEGFNKVVAEGVLAGRPVITSSVCPALEYVRDAVVEVPPDESAAYGTAILQLSSDHALYESKRLASASVRAQFYDPARGWMAAVKTVVARLVDSPD